MPSGGAKASRPDKLLTPQELAFARAYVADPDRNGTKAALAAGYAKSGAKVRASTLLRRPHVAAYIESISARAAERVSKRAEEASNASRNQVTRSGGEPVPISPPIVDPLPFVLDLDAVVREMALMGFANMADFVTITAEGGAFVDLSRVTRAQMAAVKEIKVEEFADGRGKDAQTVIRTTLKLTDKVQPLLALGKHLGGFKEQHAHDVTPGGALDELIRHLRGITRSALPIAPADWSDAEIAE